jgi:hypothetical protein
MRRQKASWVGGLTLPGPCRAAAAPHQPAGESCGVLAAERPDEVRAARGRGQSSPSSCRRAGRGCFCCSQSTRASKLCWAAAWTRSDEGANRGRSSGRRSPAAACVERREGAAVVRAGGKDLGVVWSRARVAVRGDTRSGAVFFFTTAGRWVISGPGY